MTSQPNIEKLIVEAIQDRKGQDITIVDLREIDSASVDTFIICQGKTPTQVAAIADSVREQVQEKSGIKPYNYDGYRNAQWIVIDYGDLMVHIFTPDNRSYYNLEELWSDALLTDIPNLD